jgi:hypothetical protein
LLAILPSLRGPHIAPAAITPTSRYTRLHEARKARRGSGYEYRIEGLDRLAIRDDDILLAGAFTSLQLHWQIAPQSGAAEYNWAQLIAAPCLAAAAASPLLLGRRLWHETRIPLFEQTSDLHCRHKMPASQRRSRAGMGPGWIDHILDVWHQDVASHEPVLGLDVENHSGQRPAELKYLQFFNSTVYRWNRLCYGTQGGGQPALRIEARMLPSGPTLADEMSNAAFWWGLMAHGTRLGVSAPFEMPFDRARENFRRAARDGLECQLLWTDGQRYAAADLIETKLLPLAREGLQNRGMKDADKWLDPLIRRVAQRRSASRWMLDAYDRLSEGCDPASASRELTGMMIEYAEDALPVCDWPVLERRAAVRNSDRAAFSPMPSSYETADARNGPAGSQVPVLSAFGHDVPLSRVAFHLDSGEDGPLLVIVAGLHGNELNGVASLWEAALHLLPEAGAVAGLLGNLSALALNVRYVDEDLNRAFAGRPAPEGSAEQREKAALLQELERLKGLYPGRPAWLIDLHGTSGHSPPYLSLLGATAAWPLRGRLPVTEVAEFETMFSGTLVEHAARSGWRAATFEAGALSAPVAVMNGVSLLRLLADELSIRKLDRGRRSSLRKGLAAQAPVSGGFRFVFRHEIRPSDGFVMKPGFVSFQPVEAGEVLGNDVNGPVRAPFSARLLMPLYQSKGQSGYFLIQPQVSSG